VFTDFVDTFAFNLNKVTMNELNRIKVVLVEHKQTGKWLAEQLGVSVTTTSRWCSNAAQPDLSTFVKIASLLDVDVKDLIVSTKKS
jgi:transcriptional regulator with XRE-family HTH domain